jgi:hypothetical protein
MDRVSSVIRSNGLEMFNCVAVSAGSNVGSEINPLELVLRLLETHVEVTPAERMAIALWALHTHVVDRFSFTPRLALLSPVKRCGKTTVLALLETLVAEPFRTDNVTAAAIYHWLDCSPRSTLLFDEGDNLDMARNSVLRSVFNSGHRRGGNIARFVGGLAQQFPTFAPLALAAIGSLPSPLLDRSIPINMHRLTPGRILQSLDEVASLRAAREATVNWSAKCSLNLKPPIPPALDSRAADNWRVLFSIADDLGYGEQARAAATELSAHRRDEDPGVVLLTGIRAVFNEQGIDRIGSAKLVNALLRQDEECWTEWRGPHDNRPARDLTQGEVARLLRPFGIIPRTVWPVHRRATDKSSRGYMKCQFEEAWRFYCSDQLRFQTALAHVQPAEEKATSRPPTTADQAQAQIAMANADRAKAEAQKAEAEATKTQAEFNEARARVAPSPASPPPQMIRELYRCQPRCNRATVGVRCLMQKERLLEFFRQR